MPPVDKKNPEYRDMAFWRAVMDLVSKQDPALKSPEIRKRIEDALLYLIEHCNGFASLVGSTAIHAAENIAIVRFVAFSKRIGFANHNIGTIIKSLLGLHSAPAKSYMINVSKNLSGIGSHATKIAAASTVFLAFTTSIQVIVHSKRGDYGLALGELVKAVCSLASAPLAFLDLVDQLACVFCPKIMQNPFVRLIRIFPSTLEALKQLANTFVTLAHVYIVAEGMGNVEITKKLNKLADDWEKSAFGVTTEISRGVVHDLACRAPWLLRIEWIKNLAEYHEHHPLAW